MIKYLMLCITVIGLTSCAEKDELYYRSHPKELGAVLQHCDDKKGNHLDCKKIEEIADQLNRLAYQLRMNPQAFGNKILQLQQEIAAQKEQLSKGDRSPQLQQELEANQRHLADLMIVVKWLESPEG